MLKVLVADMSREFTSALSAELDNEFTLKICHDGETALRELASFQPDALILNLTLPFKDGMTVLQETTFVPRVILGITYLTQQHICMRAIELGVQFLLIMPAVRTVRNRLLDLLAEAQPQNDLYSQVASHLRMLHFHSHLDGYRQLCIGVPLFAQNPHMLLSKELYPAISAQYHLPDPRTVEHSIRKSISDAWMRRDPEVWSRYFPSANTPPTNKAFICRLAELLKF